MCTWMRVSMRRGCRERLPAPARALTLAFSGGARVALTDRERCVIRGFGRLVSAGRACSSILDGKGVWRSSRAGPVEATVIGDSDWLSCSADVGSILRQKSDYSCNGAVMEYDSLLELAKCDLSVRSSLEPDHEFVFMGYDKPELTSVAEMFSPTATNAQQDVAYKVFRTCKHVAGHWDTYQKVKSDAEIWFVVTDEIFRTRIGTTSW